MTRRVSRRILCLADPARNPARTVIDAFMGAEAEAICGAEYGTRTPERVNVRNSYGHPDFDTRRQGRDAITDKLPTVADHLESA